MSARVAIVYASWDGQTRRIGVHLADRLRQAGVRAHAFSADRVDLDFDPRAHDLVVLGAAVRMHRHPRSLEAFARRYRGRLNATATAFFSVSASASSDEPAILAENLGWIDEFAERTGVRVDHRAVFGGAVPYTRYPLLTKLVMRAILARQGGPTDTSRDHELTDWRAVDAFAHALLAALPEDRAGRRPDDATAAPA